MENSQLIELNTKRLKPNEYNTMINDLGLVSFNSESTNSQQISEAAVCKKKMSRIDSFELDSPKLSNLSTLLPLSSFEKDATLNKDSTSENSSLPLLTDAQMSTIATKYRQLLIDFNSLSFPQQTNIFKVVDNLNSKNQLLSVREASQICPLKNIEIYSVFLSIADVTDFSSSAYKKRDAVGIVGLKLIQFISQLNLIVKHFSQSKLYNLLYFN